VPQAELDAELQLITQNDPVKLSWSTRKEIASFTGGRVRVDDLKVDESKFSKQSLQLLRTNGVLPS